MGEIALQILKNKKYRISEIKDKEERSYVYNKILEFKLLDKTLYGWLIEDISMFMNMHPVNVMFIFKLGYMKALYDLDRKNLLKKEAKHRFEYEKINRNSK